MECRPLEITLICARDLKDVNFFSKMDVYAVVSVKGDPYYTSQKQKTPVDKDSGPNPNWNHTMKFTLDEDSLQKNRLALKFELISDRSLGDREIGEVHVPIKELLDHLNRNDGADANKPSEQNVVNYSVRTLSGKSKGTLNFSFKFGDKIPTPAGAGKDKHRSGEPVMAYPAAGSSAQAPAYGGYPPPPPPQQPYPYPYPAPGGYVPPPQAAYGGYPPHPGYGYPPQQGYGYPAQPGFYGGYAQPQQPKKNNGGKMALGVGAGLLGGLLIGDMVSDVGEMAAYDAGYDAGLDDGFGF